MPRYLIQISYTPEAWKALVASPQDRIAAVRPAVEKLGGKLVGGYFAFGEYDIVAISEMPDNVSAAATSIAFAGGGMCKSVKTTPLLTTAEAAEALKKAASSGYRPPRPQLLVNCKRRWRLKQERAGEQWPSGAHPFGLFY